MSDQEVELPATMITANIVPWFALRGTWCDTSAVVASDQGCGHFQHFFASGQSVLIVRR